MCTQATHTNANQQQQQRQKGEWIALKVAPKQGQNGKKVKTHTHKAHVIKLM